MKFAWRILLLAATAGFFTTAHAEGFFLDPNIGVGFNSVQQTYYRIGLDLGYHVDENWYGGVGAYYAFGEHPEHDREIGGGPFVGYVYPIVSFLSLQLREDVDYVDQRDPVLNSGNPDFYTHTQDYGVISGTYAGIHLSFTRNFGVAVGYRLVLGLTKSSMADGRSGAAFGLLIGI